MEALLLVVFSCVLKTSGWMKNEPYLLGDFGKIIIFARLTGWFRNVESFLYAVM